MREFKIGDRVVVTYGGFINSQKGRVIDILSLYHLIEFDNYNEKMHDGTISKVSRNKSSGYYYFVNHRNLTLINSLRKKKYQ